MDATNTLFILSDQHTRSGLGCYGGPATTPHLDRLAERGTRFDTAYTNCPICVPVRASLATGRWVHQAGYWDNAFPYEGRVPSWHQRLRDGGVHVDSIGKLHFSRLEDDHGFTQEVEPLHVVDGIGDVLGCLRDDGPFRLKRSGILEAGPGDSTYLQYDRRNADNGMAWLEQHRDDDKPWAAMLSFVCPHPPYICPPEWFEHYIDQDLPMPPQWRQDDWPAHPVIDHFRRFFDFHPQFDESQIRRLLAAYYGACSFLDEQIGRVLQQLESLGLSDRTRVIYSSDHGEHLGGRGIFGKFSLYDESAAIPLITAGPDVPHGHVCRTPASLIDIHPSMVESVGLARHEEDAGLPGRSLWTIASNPDAQRTVLSEYHAVGSRHASYMLRDARYKYNHYIQASPQLFDLQADPDELVDLADDPACAEQLVDCETRLRRILDPEAVDLRARSDQEALVESMGGAAAVRDRGAFDNSPAPGETPTFRQH
ncbi:MAG: sulfatase-like hydrolase/transferase [Gemmatimonadetes bacterium]|nr:sulfatase-like hydrolase/transferase [Gemmatimonadota bacterium]MBT7859103.1 sulfatase-like hydrolase/transferase [Gemmatimonadota bacterium]